MMQDEAAQLCCKYADLEMNRPHMDEIDIVIGELGYFALAITLTGARTGSAIPPISSPQTFRDEYRHYWKDSLGETPTPIVNRYPRNLLNTLETSFEAVQQKWLAASNILCVLASLSPSDIFLGLFDVEHGSLVSINDIDQVKSAARPSILSSQVVDRSVLEATPQVLRAHCLQGGA